MSLRGQSGKQARGRRGDQDSDLDNTAWLEALDKAATEQDDGEEEEWASKLRRRRSQDPEPPAPRAPDPPGRAPELPRAPVAHDLSPYPPLGSEPAAPPPPPSSPGPGPAREPDYPALFGELNRRSAAQREALWESAPAPEPYEESGSPEPPAPTWPFEETTGTWEPSDRSFIWPAEELPAAPSEWEPSTPSWLDEPTAQPPTWQAAPADAAPPGPPTVAPGVGAAADDWAAGIESVMPPPARGLGERAGDPAARRWRPDEAVEAEPAVPLGANGMAPPRSVADHVQMAEPTDNWKLDERPRSSWPKVVAIVSWIVLLMVVCWFYVFPWLERVLPENF